MRKLIAVVAALFLLGSMAGTVGAASGDKAVVFDGARAHVYARSGEPLLRANGASAIAVAKQFLARHGRDTATLASLKAESKFKSRGITHITYGQFIGGLRIYGAYAKVAVNARGNLIHVIDNLAKVPSSVAGAKIGAGKALYAAIAKNLPNVADRPGQLRTSGATTYFKKTISFRESPKAERVLVARASGALEQGFAVTTWTKKGNKLHVTLVDRGGRVAATELRTAKDSYNVYTNSPLAGTQTVVQGPGDGNLESPEGWLEGAQTTKNIQGNNVHAYLDRDANNKPDAGGTNVTSGDFLADSDLTDPPTTDENQQVAVQNLFYLNNVLHDELYSHGFTEAAGNFQEDNFGKGGKGSDSVNAEAQDGSGTDNANFATPPDGSNPRMQMFLWTPPGGQQEVVVGGTAYDAVSMGYGPGLSTTGVTAPLLNADDGVAPTGDACESLPKGSLDGAIALVDRGTCNFDLKSKNAQAAGAVGVIIINNQATAIFAGDGSSGGLKVPTVMVSQADGAAIRAALPASGTMRTKAVLPPMLDADLDSDVVYHEYGHGLTWRLINHMDGPMAGAIGEGGGDTLAMFMNQDPAIGEWSASSPDGIRSDSYDTLDKTYSDMTGAEVHADGEVYGAIMWRLMMNYATGGSSIEAAFDDWVQGMMFTPTRPSVEDMRDGMLMASNHDCLIWEAFAHFGVGVGASGIVGPQRAIVVTESFDVPPSCD
ncbi:MAG TPA: M36 family metallopeptidase [Candidatus Limnocylindrales bacterium]|nr:M36 family metallopeptidase [Candidatus Limnocylindrales bacterium]